MVTSVSRSSSKQSRSPSSSSCSSKTSSSAVSSHLAMLELKSRIISSLSKLSDRDTHHIAADDLALTIRTLPPDGVPMLLSSLLHDPPSDPSSKHLSPLAARRESLRLLALLCSAHPHPSAAHLPKIIAHIVRRFKDPTSDSSVRDACRDAAGSLSGIYIRPSPDEATPLSSSPVVTLFVKPLLEAMGEQSKVVQAGAAMCLAKVVDCAGGGVEGGRPSVGGAFQKLCPRLCKLLGSQHCLAKGALLSVASSLSQAGAISSQGIQLLLQSVRECLDNSDWATRKAAADTLSVLASYSSHLVADGADSTIAALEACHFDKVKPVRDSMSEALLLWKKNTEKRDDETSEDPKDSRRCEMYELEERTNEKRPNHSNRASETLKDSSACSSPTGGDALSKSRGSSNISEKKAVLLKKKAPSLTDKEPNPEFFLNLETRSSDDLPVEVVVPRRCLQSSHVQGEETELIDSESRVTPSQNGALAQGSNETHDRTNIYQNAEKRLRAHKMHDLEDYARDKWIDQRGTRAKDFKLRTIDTDNTTEISHKDPSAGRGSISRADCHAEGSFINNKGNWLAIQRQLSQLERQQANLMNMLQDFMGGSHDSMVTLENRVRGLERIIEEMARDLALSAGRRGGNMMMGCEGSPGRSSNKYNGFNEYPGAKFGRNGESRIPFAERLFSSDGIISGVRGRDPPWRSDSEAWDSYAYAPMRNGFMNSKRGSGPSSVDGRLSRIEHDSDQAGSRRSWEKGQGPFRLGEGPSARSVWQASKDEATLEAIRGAGEDNGTSRFKTRGAAPELDAEALVDENPGQDRGPLWDSWTRAMDSLHIGDADSAYAEVLSTGDDLLLVKLMDKSGPVLDQFSSEIACEVLRAVSQFLLEQSLLDVALPWTQQLTDLVAELGTDFPGIPLEGKKEILLNLHDASSLEPPEDWEGPHAEQLMVRLAAAWGISVQHLSKH